MVDSVAETVARYKETITYLPDHGDPVTTRWAETVFNANVPVELACDPNGTKREQQNHRMVELARGNRFFQVGKEKKVRAKRDARPTSADEYKSYMIGWLQNETFESADDLISRFARDRELQLNCELGPEDFAYLGTLFLPKLSDIAKAEGMTENQIASAWLRHGINQTPF